MTATPALPSPEGAPPAETPDEVEAAQGVQPGFVGPVPTKLPVYADEALQPIVESATGLALDEFFAHAVRGREELDFEGPLAAVGLSLKRGSGVEGSEREGAWLGASTRSDGCKSWKPSRKIPSSPRAKHHRISCG